MTTAGLLLLGAAVGVLSAMLGIGGGVILVPALVILFGLSQAEAQGTSLATIPFGAIIAAMIYHQSAPLRVPVVVAVAAGFVAGAFLGPSWSLMFPRRRCGRRSVACCSTSGSCSCSTCGRLTPSGWCWHRLP